MVWRWRAYLRAEFAVLNVMAVSFQTNKLHITREPIGENVVFLDNESEKTKFDTFRAELLHRDKNGTPMYVSVS